VRLRSLGQQVRLRSLYIERTGTIWEDEVIIGVDLDGVCADIIAAYRQYVARYRGVRPETLGTVTDYNFSSWGFERPLTSQPEFYRALQDGMAAGMEPMAGAADGLIRLSKAGFVIRIMTGRLVAPGMSRTAIDTITWLDNNRFIYNDVCFVSRKRDVLADVYVDDDPAIINELTGQGKRAIVFDQPYNRITGMPNARVTSWAELTATLLEIAYQYDTATN
jgi:5'-nucleotidase